MNQTGRERATRHCLDCRYHYKENTPVSPHTCSKAGGFKIGHTRVRTSPDWCPLGHWLPGVAFPCFERGEDPRYTEAEAEEYRKMARLRPY